MAFERPSSTASGPVAGLGDDFQIRGEPSRCAQSVADQTWSASRVLVGTGFGAFEWNIEPDRGPSARRRINL